MLIARTNGDIVDSEADDAFNILAKVIRDARVSIEDSASVRVASA
jgi:hypothetical protein